jgi:hypothetical protein
MIDKEKLMNLIEDEKIVEGLMMISESDFVYKSALSNITDEKTLIKKLCGAIVLNYFMLEENLSKLGNVLNPKITDIKQ